MGESDVFSTNDFVELDIPKVSKQSIILSRNRKDIITVRAAEIEIDVVPKILFGQNSSFCLAIKFGKNH